MCNCVTVFMRLSGKQESGVFEERAGRGGVPETDKHKDTKGGNKPMLLKLFYLE